LKSFRNIFYSAVTLSFVVAFVWLYYIELVQDGQAYGWTCLRPSKISSHWTSFPTLDISTHIRDKENITVNMAQPDSKAYKVILLMADYGHDPTETAIPYTAFTDAGFLVTIATETGKVPSCDSKMLTGWTQKLLVDRLDAFRIRSLTNAVRAQINMLLLCTTR
jgi:hypothetical protein